MGFVSILFDIIFLLQHYVWYPETGHHQRTVVEVGKSSELASPIPKNIDNLKNSPFNLDKDKNPKELEAQKNNTERVILS